MQIVIHHAELQVQRLRARIDCKCYNPSGQILLLPKEYDVTLTLFTHYLMSTGQVHAMHRASKSLAPSYSQVDSMQCQHAIQLL